MAHKDNIASALFSCMDSAKEQDLEELGTAIDALKAHRHTYAQLMRHPFCRAILGVCNEVLEIHRTGNENVCKRCNVLKRTTGADHLCESCGELI